ncbi:MAG: hypothetical protein ACNA71_03470, partial [Kiritimatiellia bacterium]
MRIFDQETPKCLKAVDEPLAVKQQPKDGIIAPAITLVAINARYSHCSLATRSLMANMRQMQ